MWDRPRTQEKEATPGTGSLLTYASPGISSGSVKPVKQETIDLKIACRQYEYMAIFFALTFDIAASYNGKNEGKQMFLNKQIEVFWNLQLLSSETGYTTSFLLIFYTLKHWLWKWRALKVTSNWNVNKPTLAMIRNSLLSPLLDSILFRTIVGCYSK